MALRCSLQTKFESINLPGKSISIFLQFFDAGRLHTLEKWQKMVYAITNLFTEVEACVKLPYGMK